MFLEDTEIGKELMKRMKSKDVISAFVGDNSRFAGQTVITNYRESGAGYYGEMKFKKGIGLLETSSIMPHTFLKEEYYENTASSVPYAIVKDHLTYGIWLTSGNFIKYKTEVKDIVLEAYGDIPVMILKNKGTKTGFSMQTADGEGTPRQVAGFKQMDLSVIDEGMVYKVGEISNNHSTGTSTADNRIPDSDKPKIRYNKECIHVDWNNLEYSMAVIDLRGNIRYSSPVNYNETLVCLRGLNTGVYFVRLKNIKSNRLIVKKILVK
jgi:hypothetical protein